MGYAGELFAANPNEAFKLSRDAAEQGNVDADVNVGVLYLAGQGGVEKDYGEAYRRFKSSADLGNQIGRHELGYMYARGLGVPVDVAKGRALMREAAMVQISSEQTSFFELRPFPTEAPKGKHALAWLRRGAEHGSQWGQYILGTIYESGALDVAPDFDEAAGWQRKAAKQGNAHGAEALGRLYETGRGVKKDLVEAFGWYSLAAKKGASSSRSSPRATRTPRTAR